MNEKLEILDKLLYEKIRIMRWLIQGQGQLGIPISAVSVLTKEWICKHYNVELSYFIE